MSYDALSFDPEARFNLELQQPSIEETRPGDMVHTYRAGNRMLLAFEGDVDLVRRVWDAAKATAYEIRDEVSGL